MTPKEIERLSVHIPQEIKRKKKMPIDDRVTNNKRLWTNVNLSKPWYGKEVLLRVKYENPPSTHARIIGHRKYTDEKGEHYNIHGTVTHWAELPELSI